MSNSWSKDTINFDDDTYREPYMLDISFLDSLHGMIASGDIFSTIPKVITTIDGGKSWQPVWCDTIKFVFDSATGKNKAVFVPGKLMKLSYLDTNLVFGLASGRALPNVPYIMRSTDNGKSWERIMLDSNEIGSTINMLDKKYGLCITSQSLYMTEDSGKTWDKKHIAALDTFPNHTIGPFDAYYLDRDNIILYLMYYPNFANQKRYILRTEDRGNSWNLNDINLPSGSDCFFIDKNNGWLCRQTNVIDSSGKRVFTDRIYHTSDGGRNWIVQLENQNVNVKRKQAVNDVSNWSMHVRFFDKLNGVAYGYYTNLYLTTDGGMNWVDQVNYQNYQSGKMRIADFTAASYIVSKDKIILSTAVNNLLFTYTSSSLEVRTQNTSKSFKSEPIKKLIVGEIVEFDVSTENDCPVTILLYDIRGVFIKKLYYSPLINRNPKITCDLADIPTGIYISKIIAGTTTKFQMLMKGY